MLRDIIAIPTFNRGSLLAACLTSLKQARGLERYRIFVRDDASSEFGVDEIRQLIPRAESIERNAANLGPFSSQLLLFRDCLHAGARRILIVDSDMIVSPSILEFAERAFERSDGVLGLYNSVLHETLGDIDDELIEKRSIGGTTTCWDAELMSRVVEYLDRIAEGRDVRTGWNWDTLVLDELRALRRRFIVSRRSYAQHMGIRGTNNRTFGRIDYGTGFVIETEAQAHAMAAVFDGLMAGQDRFLPRPRKRSAARRLLDALKPRRHS